MLNRRTTGTPVAKTAPVLVPPAKQAKKLSEDMIEVVWGLVFYLPLLLVTYVANSMQISGNPLILGDITVSPGFTGVIGCVISLLIAARIREVGSERAHRVVGIVFFDIPIIPLIVAILLAAPFLMVLL